MFANRLVWGRPVNTPIDTKRIAERWPDSSPKHIAIRASQYFLRWMLYNLLVAFLPIMTLVLVLTAMHGKAPAITGVVEPRDLFLIGFGLLAARLFDMLEKWAYRKVLIASFAVLGIVGLEYGVDTQVIHPDNNVAWPVSICYIVVTVLLIAFTYATATEGVE
jgi:hypothetical protein